ncbi:MAG: hypothetical protein ACOYU2_05970 [Nitrospirota bacterium]
MNALKLRLRQINKKGIAIDITVLAAIVALYYFGWRTALGAFTTTYGTPLTRIPEEKLLGSEIKILPGAFLLYFSVGLYGFMAAMAAAYNRITAYIFFGWGLLEYNSGKGGFNKHSLWFYRALVFVQAFCAGLTLHTIKILLIGEPKSAYYVSASIMLTIIFFTWAIKYLKPRITVALMPIALFLIGMAVSQGQVNGLPDNQAAENYKSMVEFFKTLPKLVFLGDIVISITVAVCIAAGALYFIGRPFMVFGQWERNIQGSALNAFIAIYLVIAPYVAEKGGDIIGKHNYIRSIADSVIYLEGSFLTLIAWSWIIGNVASLMPYAINMFSALFKRKRQIV